MKVALLASMMIEVGFDQGPSMNVINFKIVWRCCGKNVFKDPDDDDEGFVSSFVTLEDAMLSLPMACYYHRLKSIVMFGTKNDNSAKFIRNRLLHLLSREEEPDFDHIWHCSLDQSKLDYCFGDDQCIVCAMKRDETAHELNLKTMKQCFMNSLPNIGITSMFIHLLVNKSTRDHLRIGNCADITLNILVRQSVWFLMLWRWKKWKTFQFMITWKQGGLISTTRWQCGWLRYSIFMFQSSQLCDWLVKNVIFG